MERLRELKSEEISTQDSRLLLQEVNSNAKQLNGIQSKLESKVSKQLNVKEELLKRKDETIQGTIFSQLYFALRNSFCADLKSKLETISSEHEEEIKSLRESFALSEKATKDEKVKLEVERKELKKAEIDLDMKKRR